MLKVMKNPCYFLLKALFVLEIFNFLSLFLFMWVNCLIRKLRLISKFNVANLKTNNCHICKKGKDNKIMKLGQ